MKDEEKIRQVFCRFEEGGLVKKDLNQVLSCISDNIIGIGIGEQGFVTSKEDISEVLINGDKEDRETSYSLTYDRIETRLHTNDMAVLCAEITVTAKSRKNVIRSRFSQSITFVKENDEWKICCLHASAPIVTEENVEAYPLKFAEKTLKSLKEKIGEEVYATEEQYRMAILLDTIAFYMINFTTDTYEKCQLNSDLCVYVKPGSRYEQFGREHIAEYVAEEDRKAYLDCFALSSIFRAFEDHEDEVKYEYRMLNRHDGSFIWVVTVIRLITDIVTGEQKGIMYVKNIDSTKRQKIAMQERADYDDMLKLYNRTAFIAHVDALLERGEGAFFMMDIDNFKAVNDTYGHPFGDKVLVETARILKESFPQQTVFGRLGGDEFGIFLPGLCDRELITGCMEKLFERLNRFSGQDGEEITISCSAGIACSRGDKHFRELYQDADEALYDAKQRGKKCFSFCEV